MKQQELRGGTMSLQLAGEIVDPLPFACRSLNWMSGSSATRGLCVPSLSRMILQPIGLNVVGLNNMTFKI